jgi:amino acid permease
LARYPPPGHSSPGSLVTIREREQADEARRGCFGAGSLKGSVVNIAQATLGAGALSLPKAFYFAGILWSMIFMLILVVLAVMSITVVIQTIDMSGKNTFEEMAKKAFGPRFTLFFELNIILFCFGTAVGYMMTVGDIFSQVALRIVGCEEETCMHHHSLFAKLVTNPKFLIVIITIILLFPLSMVDKINELRYASLVGVSCILFLVAVVIYVFCRGGSVLSFQDSFEPQNNDFTGIFNMLSLAILLSVASRTCRRYIASLSGKV